MVSKGKGFLYLSITVIIVAVATFFIYQYNTYPVNIKSDNLGKKIAQNINTAKGQKRTEQVIVKVMKVAKLDDSNVAIAFVSVNGEFGRTRLVKGLNGRYKIMGTRWKSELKPAQGEIFNTSRGKYQVFMGHNVDFKVKSIKAKAYQYSVKKQKDIYSDFTSIVSVPSNEYYLVYKKLPEDKKLPYYHNDQANPISLSIKSYDENGEVSYSIK